jgi:hypothetical protein
MANKRNQILVLGFAALSIIITFYGIGMHQTDVPLADLAVMQKVPPYQVFAGNAI